VSEREDLERYREVAARAALAAVTEAKRVLVVLGRDDELSRLSARNLTHVHLITPDQLNTYDVLVNDDIVFTKAALDAFLAGQAKGKGAKAAVPAGAGGTGAATSSEVEGSDEQ
jgi:large subunit ribosomal protein L4